MTKYLRAPHPFVIEPPLDMKNLYAAGETLSFDLVLIGRGNDYLPYFVYAFEELGNSFGIGRGKGKFRLERVEWSGETVYDGETKSLISMNRKNTEAAKEKSAGSVNVVHLNFSTPTRIVLNEKLVAEPDFQSIFRTLLRRISMLSYFHCGKELDLDYKSLIDRSAAVKTVARKLRWWDWERYSARQDEKMKLGGFAGEMTFAGELEAFLPFLRAGELVHVGKGTGFGLGKYEIKSTEHRDDAENAEVRHG